MSNPLDLIPASKVEFAAEMVPCLTLVAPAGMDKDERKTWLAAAYRALDGIPIALLQRGAAAASLKADHPSKIVAAIYAEVGDNWERRKRLSRPHPSQLVISAPVEPEPDYCKPEEAAEILAQAGRRFSAASDPSRPKPQGANPDRAARMPTREDYIRMFGVDPGDKPIGDDDRPDEQMAA